MDNFAKAQRSGPIDAPRMNALLIRLARIEEGFRSNLARLQSANDRILGGDKTAGGETANLVPRGGALLNAIENSIDRIEGMCSDLAYEANRVDNLSTIEPALPQRG